MRQKEENKQTTIIYLTIDVAVINPCFKNHLNKDYLLLNCSTITGTATSRSFAEIAECQIQVLLFMVLFLCSRFSTFLTKYLHCNQSVIPGYLTQSIPRFNQTIGFLMFSGGKERNLWHEIG